MDLNTPPDQLGPEFLRVATNVLVDRGTVRLRGGQAKYNANPITGGQPVQGLHRFYTSAGTKQILAISNGKLWYATAGIFSEGKDAGGASLGASASNDFDFVTLQDKAYFSDGVSGPFSWDGSKWVKLLAISVPTPSAKLAPTYNVLNACDSTSGWSTTDETNTPVTTISAVKFEGTSSIRIKITKAESANDIVQYDAGAGGIDLSGVRHIGFWIRGSRAGTFLKFGFGESAADENQYPVRIRRPGEWQYWSQDIQDLPDSAKDGARYFAFTCIEDDVGCYIFVDNLLWSGGLNGVYEYRITYYDSVTGLESAPAGARTVRLRPPRYESVVVDWTLAGASSQADKVRIYRKGGISGIWRLVSEVSDTDLSYTDHLAEHLLGVEQDPYRGAPPACKYLEVFRNRMAYAGNPSSPSTLYLSNYEEPSVVPSITLLEQNANAGGYLGVEANDGDVITALRAFGEQLLIFKHHSVHRLFGTSFRDFELHPLTREVGAPGRRSVCTFQDTILWYTGSSVVKMTQGGAIEIIGDPVRARLETISAANRAKVCAVVHDMKYWVFYCDGTVAYNNCGLVYDLRRNGWTELTGWQARCAMELAAPGDEELIYYGDGNAGTVWQANTGYQDNSVAIPWCIETGQLDFDDVTSEKALSRYLIVARNAGELAQVEVRADDGRAIARQQETFRALDVGASVPEQVVVEGQPSMDGPGRLVSLRLSGAASSEIEVQRLELHARRIG